MKFCGVAHFIAKFPADLPLGKIRKRAAANGLARWEKTAETPRAHLLQIIKITKKFGKARKSLEITRISRLFGCGGRI